MACHEENFFTADGVELCQKTWLPDGEPRAVVLLVHGLFDHGGRYAELAEELNRHEYAVYAVDLRGHGKSAGERAWVRRFDDFIDDSQRFLQHVRACQPGKPVFLLGHSMGGAIVALWAIQRKPPVRGVILSAAATSVGGRVFPVLRHLAALLSLLAPRLRLIRMGARNLSRDPAVVEDFRNDPLVFHGRFPVRIGAEILAAARQIHDRAAALELPVLILHGTGDVTTDPAGSRHLFDAASAADKTLKLYDGLYHDLLHEPERRQVTADVIGWLDERSGRA